MTTSFKPKAVEPVPCSGQAPLRLLPRLRLLRGDWSPSSNGDRLRRSCDQSPESGDPLSGGCAVVAIAIETGSLKRMSLADLDAACAAYRHAPPPRWRWRSPSVIGAPAGDVSAPSPWSGQSPCSGVNLTTIASRLRPRSVSWRQHHPLEYGRPQRAQY